MEPDPLDTMRDYLMKFAVEPSAVRTAIAETRKQFGGASNYIRAIDRPARDADIRAALTAGKPVDAVAKLAGCSPATVRRRRSRWL